jgi:versiconal hemiacetal acetate reductase
MAAWEFQALQNVAARNGWHQFISMQSYYSLIGREDEQEMIPYCLDSGVGLIPWSPLGRGVLARPRNKEGTLRESTDDYLNALILKRWQEADEVIVDRVEEMAAQKGVGMAQVATAWLLSKQDVSPILGLNSKKRIDEAIASLKVQLSRDDIAHLEEPYVPKPFALRTK